LDRVIPESPQPDGARSIGQSNRAAIGLSALGIVFGDIGTSPLYTLKTVLALTGGTPTPDVVLGALSLILWTLIIVTSVKYVTIAMSIDNDGEGGILALMSLLGIKKQHDGHADIVRDFAWALPALVLFRILGIPDDEVPRVKEGSWTRVRAGARRRRASSAFSLRGEPRSRSDGAPAQDFVSDLVNAKDSEGKGLASDQAATVVLNLLFAGHETTTGLLGNVFRRLLAHRDSWEAICHDPKLIPVAIEEVLRLDTSVIAWRRQTTQ
jgi:hypothetical protein